MEFRFGNNTHAAGRALVMGILNVTPDSFSDGGRYKSVDHAIEHGLAMAEAGASIIDVGGESTRPGAADVSIGEELERVIPVIERLAAESVAVISVDTSKPEVMREAVGAGAGIINDVYALRREGALDAAAGTAASVCLMHMRGTPADMQREPQYRDVVAEVYEFLQGRVADCVDAGISRDRLIVDPGFGFGKNDDHNLRLLANLDRFRSLGQPLLVGLSRKRTLGNLTGKGVGERVAAGIAAALAAVARGADIVRTHDVPETVDALKIFEAVEMTGRQR